jgi:alpha-L-fucosidase
MVVVIILTTSPLQAGKYKAEWGSVKKHPDPKWFADAKFGIYFHWGPYSVPAYKTEWYSHYMYVTGHACNKYHLKTYGPLDKFGYKDFIPMFKAEKFDADA